MLRARAAVTVAAAACGAAAAPAGPSCSVDANSDCDQHDIRNAGSVGSAADCCALCGAEAECAWWTWNRGYDMACWLKTACPSKRGDSNADSGASPPKAPTPAPAPADWVIENGTNYFQNCAPMSKYPNFVQLGTTSSAEGCESLCKAHSGCQSWTWHAWGAPDDTCVGRTDGMYREVKEGGHVSGRSDAAKATGGCASPAPPPPPPSTSCPHDCSLNGVCESNACRCDAAWEGDDCGRLALLPSQAEPAYGGPSADFASWGGGVLRAEGGYHMFVAEMANHCGLQSWQHNSVIRHAVSESPTGPFVAKEIVKSYFSHGPTPVYDNHTGTYLIYHDGDGTPSGKLCSGCSGGVTPVGDAGCGLGADADAGNMTTGRQRAAGGSAIMYSSSVNGPWSDMDSDGWWNPAPFVNPDGSVSLVVQSDKFQIQSAPKWQGPYTHDTHELLPSHQEDPWLWRDQRGNYHMLMHGMTPYAQEQYAGRHAYSRSGAAGEWTLSPTSAYTSVIDYEDGSTKKTARRERPHLLLDAGGAPTHLYTSVQERWGDSGSRNDKTYTHVQKIRTA